MEPTELGIEILEELNSADTVLFENRSGLPDDQVQAAIKEQYPELLSRSDIAKLDDWMGNSKVRGRSGGIFSQNKYVAPEKIFDQFKSAAKAAKDDDIFSNAVETTEQLAFKRVDIESRTDDENETNIWDQIKDHMKLEKKMREIWRELFILSQCYVAVVWERKDFKVKGSTETGKKSKKVFKNLLVPKGLMILDPCKVIPVGDFSFGQERLAYIADLPEAKDIDSKLAGPNSADLFVDQLIDRKYEPSMLEEMELARITGQYSLRDRLYLLKPENVWRITSTRPDYQRFADVRAMSVFPWLDMKHNLQEMDRTDILGNLNAIILVKKGAPNEVASNAELAQAAAQVQQSSRLPIIVSDHRLEIEIITRKTDHTLRAERYNMIDSRMTARLYQIPQTGNYAAGTATDNSPGLFKIVASTMESRRDNIRDSIVENVLDRIYEMNDSLNGEPVVRMRRIALDFDPHWAKYVFDLFALDQVSHSTVLAEVDLDIEDEVIKKRKEEKLYSDVFERPIAPGTAMPDNNSTGDAKTDGRIGGGNSNGGGTNQESFNSNPKNGKGADK